MKHNTANVRELQTDFRAVKRRIEEHGEVVITEHGEPAYIIKPLPRRQKQSPPLPDYYVRLLKQPKPLSPKATRRFWNAERG